MITVTEPCILDDLPAEDYHRDVVPGGSLSSTGARRLLPPSCPAKFRYEQDHPQPSKKEFDFGTAAHRTILGDGPEIDVLDYDNYTTKKAQQARDEAHAMGVVPLLRHEYQQVEDMAAAIRRHPLASALLDPEHGRPEVSLFCQDEATGVWMRARPDWIHQRPGGRLFIPDYKTTRDASNDAFTKSIQSFGYYQQQPWYLDCAAAVGLAGPDAEFLFVAQEKTPPYLVNVVGIDADWLRKGRARNRAALDLYAECTATGQWPGYGDEPNYLTQPVWADIRDTEEYL